MFKVNSKDSDPVQVSLLLTLNIFRTLSSIVNFEHVNAGSIIAESRGELKFQSNN